MEGTTSPGLPHGWRMKESRSHPGTMYYINSYTNEVQWEIPTIGATKIRKKSRSEMDKEVRASHIVIKHKDSRRPSSWKEDRITRTKEEAIEILKGLQKQLENLEGEELKEKFGDLASVNSDCSSAKRSGDLGTFGKGQMQKEFETATFRLEIGDLSDIVSTASGVHIILRTE